MGNITEWMCRVAWGIRYVSEGVAVVCALLWSVTTGEWVRTVKGMWRVGSAGEGVRVVERVGSSRRHEMVTTSGEEWG
jgi:hypothetical protein